MSLLVAALGLVVLSGWAFNVPALTYIRPTFQSMKGNTALSFVCLGAALWLAQNDKQQRGRRILGLSVVVIAGATLAEYAFHFNFGIDQILFRNTHMPSVSAYPGRMAISTATCLLLLGLAVTFLGLKKAIALRHTLVAICFAFSVVALCGYLYGAKSLYSVTSFSTVGVHTAAGLFAASLACFLARADEGIVSIAASDTNSGLLLRTLFPAIIVVNILIGWLRLEGQRANLYDTPFGVALLVLVSIGCLTLLSVLVARSMHRLELEHSRGEAARIRSAAIVGSSDDAIVGTDVSGTVTDWNKGAERLFGYTASEAIGKNISFITPTDQLDQAQRIFEKVTSREVLKHHETVCQRKDGTRFEISLTASPIVDVMGRVVGVSGIARDVTERKRAEEALRISEERLRLAQGAAHIGTFDLNLQTRADIWQPETEALYGLPPGGFGGTLTAFEDLIHPDDRERVIQLTKEMMRTGQPTEAEWRVVWPDGSVHWIASRGQVFMDESGEPRECSASIWMSPSESEQKTR
jgi:PAS domain S-box-containing protein